MCQFFVSRTLSLTIWIIGDLDEYIVQGRPHLASASSRNHMTDIHLRSWNELSSSIVLNVRRLLKSIKQWTCGKWIHLAAILFALYMLEQSFYVSVPSICALTRCCASSTQWQYQTRRQIGIAIRFCNSWPINIVYAQKNGLINMF